MSIETLRQGVRDVLGATFNVEPEDLPPAVGVENFDRWTSLYQLALVVGLESRFDLTFSTDEIVSMTSEDAIVEVLSTRYTV